MYAAGSPSRMLGIFDPTPDVRAGSAHSVVWWFRIKGGPLVYTCHIVSIRMQPLVRGPNLLHVKQATGLHHSSNGDKWGLC
jgi:hypothetical protein